MNQLNNDICSHTRKEKNYNQPSLPSMLQTEKVEQIKSRVGRRKNSTEWTLVKKNRTQQENQPNELFQKQIWKILWENYKYQN